MKQILLFWMLCLPLGALAQFNESFSGPEVQSNNPWEGDISKFTINSSGQLLFSSPSGEAGNASLWVPVPHEGTMTWEMDVKLDFPCTNSNNLRIYVHAIRKDSFYIQAGSNDKQVSFYEKKDGDGSPKLQIAGRKSLLDEPFSVVSIRLTLEDDQTWTLYTRKDGEAEFHKEGVCKTSLSPQDKHAAFLKLNFRYIKGRVSNFIVDNIHITSSTNELPEPPVIPKPEEKYTSLELAGLEHLSESEVQFQFDKPVNTSEAVCSVQGMGEVVITGYGKDQSIVHVQLPEPLQDGNEYFFTWSGLYDMEGKPIAEQVWSAVYEKEEEVEEVEKETPPVPCEPGQVIISEVMANTNGLAAFPQTEYVELENRSATPVSLQGWTFVYDGKETFIEGDYILPPAGYAVLYRAGREIYAAPPSLAIGLIKFPSALANTGRTLALQDATGQLIDEFEYPAARAGVSWERSPESHYLSTDPRGGTPGSPNSHPDQPEPPAPVEPPTPVEPVVPPVPDVQVLPGDIVFNEFLPNPFTGGSEYLELYNCTEHSIPLSGLAVATRKTDGMLTSYPLSGLSSAIEGGGYALLTSNKAGVEGYYLLSSPKMVYELKLPKLANTSTTLLLIDVRNGGGIIDEVTYSSQWHSPLIKDQKGVALERINPKKKTQDASNWTSASSTAGYGTPGYQNSQFGKEGDHNNTGISAPAWSEDGLYRIAYYLESPGYSCRAYIYNMAGYKVADISNNELLGTSGSITWNGKGTGGADLRPGVYIFLAELYSPSGKSLQYKKAFLVK